jgi:4-hydroxy-2-oxoheptanedioate aldolase
MAMRTNTLKALLQGGQAAPGAWMTLPSLPVARILGRLGFAWVAVDAEHSHGDLSTLAATVGAIVDAGVSAPLVRLPANSVEWFKWALDAGAWGVIVPMVSSRAEAEQAVRWAKYPPEGIRSIGGAYTSFGLGSMDLGEYYQRANAEVLVAAQIEGAAALDDLDGILGVPGIDVAFVGPNDLHAQLGLTPSSEGAEPRFVAALEQIKAAAGRHGKALGIFCSDGAAAAMRLREGFQMVSVVTDAAALRATAARELAAARAGG